MKVMYKALLFIFFTVTYLQVEGQVNTTFIGQLDYTQGVNDVWGYVDGDGVEYAIVGTQTGVSIVNLVNPMSPEEIQFINGPNTTWRDIKIWDDHAYVINESSGGLLIIDLSDMDNITWSNHEPSMPGGGNISSCHNLYIDKKGRIYVTGCNVNNGGVVFLDAVANKKQPPVIGKGPNIYSHDVFVLNDRLFASEIYAGQLAIYDITNVSNVKLIAKETTPFNFTHNAWTTTDGNYVFTTDERANAFTASYDISVDGEIELLDVFRPLATEGQGVIPHNVHVTDDNFLVISHYTDGMVVVDANRPHNLIEVGHYDTFDGNHGGFSGCWGVYPFLPSGRVLASDRQTGLYLLGVDYIQACYLEGIVTDYITSDPISGVSIEILNGDLNQASTDLNGTYATGQITPGTFNVVFSANGYRSQTLSVDLINGELTELDVQLVPLSAIVDADGHVFNGIDSMPVKDAGVAFNNPAFSYTATTDTNGIYATDDAVIGNYQGMAAAWGFREKIIDTVVLDGTAQWTDFYLFPGYEDSYTLDQGWESSGDASQGQWVREQPIGQAVDMDQTAPDSDVAFDLGKKCYVTGNGGDSASVDGVINGTATLVSPPIDLTKYNVPVISWYQWVYLENDTEAAFRYGILQDTNQIELGTLPSAINWRQFSIPDALILGNPDIDLSAPFRIYFSLENTGQHIAEAAIDAFEISDASFARQFTFNANPLCYGDTLILEDNNNHTLSWYWEIFNSDFYLDTLAEKTTALVIEDPGAYSVRLTAWSCFGDTLKITRDMALRVNNDPVANIQIDTLIGRTVQLAATGFGGFNLLNWDFGDGNTSNFASTSYTYANDGIYEITLVIGNACGTDTARTTVEIETLPEAGFRIDDPSGCADHTVQFTDSSSPNSISWNWEFEGGTPNTSTDQNPIVVYDKRGIYDVSLIVHSTLGTDTLVAEDEIRIQDVPETDFSFFVDEYDVTFNNSSEFADSYLWDFGDGNQSTESDPVHTYTENGDYEVTLAANNICGREIFSDTVSIQVLATHPVLPQGVHLYPNPFHEMITLELNGTLELQIDVTTVTGQQVDRLDLNRSGVLTFGQDWKPGVYMLRWQDKYGKLLAITRVIKH